MTRRIMIRRSTLGLMLLLLSLPAWSQALDLAAVEAQWSPPGPAAPIVMWGFIADPGSCPAGPVAWTPGPEPIALAAGGVLTVNLRNCLSEPVSIIIPGQPTSLSPQFFTDSRGRTRVRSFAHEAAAGGGVATYTWTNLKPGTFLYQSGSHPAKQVQMGLFGALKVGGYAGVIDEAMLLFSEIDPALHAPPAAATPLEYKPKYFLINGQSHTTGRPPVPVGMVNSTKLLRFVNAGLMSHTAVVQGPYMQVLAEDGNVYPYARRQYAVLLAAGKTVDALWTPTRVGVHAVYDRSMSLSTNGTVGGGMLTYLDVAPAGSIPVADAGPDQSGIVLNSTVTLDGSGSTPAVTYSWSFTLKPGGSVAVLTGASTVSPTFVPDIAGTYAIQLVVNDGTANSAPDTVVVTTNYAPVADAGPDQNVTVGDLVTLDGSASSDGDLEPLTYTWTMTVKPTGSLASLSDPLAVAPTFTVDLAGLYEVRLIVNDGNQNSAPDLVAVQAAPPSIVPPTAVDDVFTVQRNSSATFLSILANDTPGDGVIDPAAIVITTGPTTARGGRVAVKNGGAMYRPLRNFLGTDTFQYTVADDLGGVSNTATVTVNVVVP